MKLSILAGSTSQSVNVFIQDSSSTTGAGKTGLVYNTASLTAYYTFAGANCTATSITLATLAAVNSAYSSGGFKEIDATNMPGWYRLDLPNAALATGKGRSVAVHLRGAANMADTPVEIELTGWDNQDGVHGGMSALPNTACTTNASLITSGTGTAQLSVSSGAVTVGTNNDKTGYTASTVSDKTGYSLSSTQTFNVTGNITGNVSGSVGSVTGAVGSVTGAVGSVTGDVGGNVAGSVGSIAGVTFPTNFADLAITTSTGRVTAGTVSDKTGYSLTQTFPTNFADLAITATTGQVTVGTNNDKSGYSLSVTPPTAAAIADAVWDEAIADHSGTAGSTADALNAAGSAGDPWTTALPGSYTSGQAGFIVGHNIDAQLSTLSTLDAAGVWAAGTRTLTSGANIALAKGTGVTGFNDITAASVWAVARSGNQTTGTFGEYVDAAVSSRSTYSGGDTSGTTTLLSRLTSTRAGLLDNLDAAITTRLATASYTAAPTTAEIAAAILATPSQLLVTDASGFVTLASAGLDQVAVESGVNARQSLAIIGAACGGKVSGAETTSVTIDGLNNSTTRIVATVDSDGNRSAVTLTLPS